MTNEEVYDALMSGRTRFVARSKRVYLIHEDQADFLRPFADSVLLHGVPEKEPRMARQKKWVWLSPRNIKLASDEK